MIFIDGTPKDAPSAYHPRLRLTKIPSAAQNCLSMSCLFQQAVHTGPADVQGLGNFGSSMALITHLPDLRDVNGWAAAFIAVLSFRFRNAFHLPLAAKVGFKLREDAQHIQERFARRGACVDGLLCGLKRYTLGFQSANYVLQVRN